MKKSSALLLLTVACAPAVQRQEALSSTAMIAASYAFSGSVSGSSISGDISLYGDGTASLNVLSPSNASFAGSCAAQAQLVIADTLRLNCGTLAFRLPLHDGAVARQAEVFGWSGQTTERASGGATCPVSTRPGVVDVAGQPCAPHVVSTKSSYSPQLRRGQITLEQAAAQE